MDIQTILECFHFMEVFENTKTWQLIVIGMQAPIQKLLIMCKVGTSKPPHFAIVPSNCYYISQILLTFERRFECTKECNF